MDMADNTIPKIAADLIWRLVDENVVVVSPEKGDVHVLSPTGTQIWQLIADKKEVSEIETYFVKRYIVSQEQARADIYEFINNLQGLGLLNK